MYIALPSDLSVLLSFFFFFFGGGGGVFGPAICLPVYVHWSIYLSNYRVSAWTGLPGVSTL